MNSLNFMILVLARATFSYRLQDAIRPDVEVSSAATCDALLEAKYHWARWLILSSGIVVVLLISLFPLLCLQRSVWFGVFAVTVGLVLSAWVIFVLVCNTLVYSAFKHLFSSHIC
jgi:hypothetical protein